MSKATIINILRAYADGEMRLNNAVQLLGGGIIRENILKQYISGKMSFAEAVGQLSDM